MNPSQPNANENMPEAPLTDSWVTQMRPWQWMLVIWAVFSVPLVVYMGWNHLANTVYAMGSKQGSLQTATNIYSNIVTKAKNKSCNTIYVEHQGERVDLINILCLNAAKNPVGGSQ